MIAESHRKQRRSPRPVLQLGEGATTVLVESLIVIPVFSALGFLYPIGLAAVPLDGSQQPLLKGHGGFPTQLPADFATVERIPAIVPWPVFHKLDLTLGLVQDLQQAAHNIKLVSGCPYPML